MSLVKNDSWLEDPLVQAFDTGILRAEAVDEAVHIELQGLRLARRRRLQELGVIDNEGQINLNVAPVPGHVAQWREIPRTDAVLRMLREQGGQLHRRDLTERLVAAGRDDSIAAVSAALAYLAREPGAKVEALGHGMWQLKPAIFDSGPAGRVIRDAYARGEVPEEDEPMDTTSE